MSIYYKGKKANLPLESAEKKLESRQKTLQAIANHLNALIQVRADMSEEVREQLKAVKLWADKEDFYAI